jgi:hypothetical protein
MKTTIEVSQQYNAVFIPVARTIAVPPPEWLMVGLEHFSGFVGASQSTRDEHQRFTKVVERMYAATDLLIKYLPMYSFMPAALAIPEDVKVALDVLPRIKKDLARVINRKPRGGGPRPNVLRGVCAAVIVEAWKLVHRKVEPRSIKLLEACDAYWRACGGKHRGEDIENWRRDVEQAVTNNHEWIRDILLAVRN